MLWLFRVAPACSLLLLGCPTRPSVTPELLQSTQPLTDPYEAARATLAHYGYRIERLDRRAGLLRSEPLLSKQWFEFWRNDTPAAGDQIHNSLQSIRRVVTIRFKQQADDWQIDCRVAVQQLAAAPSRRRSRSSARIVPRYGRRFPELALAEETESSHLWIDIDRDAALESQLLTHLAQQLL